MNSYPFLDNRIRPIFTSNLGAITPKAPSHRVIDISNSPLVSARSLRRKLNRLHDTGEIDGGLPVVRHGVLVGLISAPDLEFALDKLEDEEQTLCLMAHNIRWQNAEEDDPDDEPDPTDFTPFIDPVSFFSLDFLAFLFIYFFFWWGGEHGDLGRERTDQSTSELGPRRIRQSFPHGPRLPVLRQAGLKIHLRPKGRTIRRLNP